jgi:hypothetical protein
LALQCLIEYDTDLNLLPDTPTNRFRLQQRYALAILQVQWDDINPFFGSVGNECEWNGVTCQSVNLGPELSIQQAVTEIYIDTYNGGNLWTGSLSPDMGLLFTLIHFNMSGNAINGYYGGLFGMLPSQIGQLTTLQSLDVSWNLLNETLPSQIWQLSNLQTLNLGCSDAVGARPTKQPIGASQKAQPKLPPKAAPA